MKRSMPFSSRVLEDSIHLDRIRRIKMTLYLVQVAMLMVLGFVVVIIMGGAQIHPSFYLPLDAFAAVLVLILLVICLESFFFRVMEIRFARSSSARHLMAKNSIRRALVVAVISAVVTMVLMTPPILSALQDATTQTEALTRDSEVAFWSTDPLALQQRIEIEASAPKTVEVYIVDAEDYEQYNGSLTQMYLLKLNKDNYVVTGQDEGGGAVTIAIPDADHRQFRLVLNDLENPGTIATVVIVKTLSSYFTGIIALLILVLTIANVAWMVYLMPIERKYSKGSIYK
jgi:plasmid maintenance system killer protein